jgi:hypothetical protein
MLNHFFKITLTTVTISMLAALLLLPLLNDSVHILLKISSGSAFLGVLYLGYLAIEWLSNSFLKKP